MGKQLCDYNFVIKLVKYEIYFNILQRVFEKSQQANITFLLRLGILSQL